MKTEVFMRKLKFFIAAVLACFLAASAGGAALPAAAAEKEYYLGGMTAGFSLSAGGAQVVGLVDVVTESGAQRPAADAGIRAGDVICEAGPLKIRSVNDLNASLNNSAGLQSGEDGSDFIYSSAMEAFLFKARIMAQTDISILILGETGVGKDVMAQRIHAMSRRADKPFIKVDCGSISLNLIESELFGYIGGAFSGASRGGRIGLIEAAAGGTVFFDEIGELPLPLQTRLLRFLQDGVIVRVGTNTPKKVDVRVVAATNKDLEKAVSRGEFRSDLYYRLKIAVLHIPPLRKRKDDILPLAEFFFRYFSRRYNRPLTMAEDVERLLLAYEWPGNVRELKSMMQEAVVTCPESVVRAHHLPIKAVPSERKPVSSEEEFDFEGKDYHDIMREMECRMLRAAIARFSGNMTAASRMLRMDRSTMFRKIRELEKHGLKVI